jgi:hypothetical protein
VLGGFFGVFEFFFTPPIAALLDELAGFGEGGYVTEEAGAGEENVGHVQPHWPTLGHLPRFIKIGSCALRIAFQKAQPGEREKAVWKVVTSMPKAVQSNGEFLPGGRQGRRALSCGVQNCSVERTTAQREVVEGDVEEKSALLRPPKCLRRPPLGFAAATITVVPLSSPETPAGR